MPSQLDPLAHPERDVAAAKAAGDKPKPPRSMARQPPISPGVNLNRSAIEWEMKPESTGSMSLKGAPPPMSMSAAASAPPLPARFAMGLSARHRSQIGQQSSVLWSFRGHWLWRRVGLGLFAGVEYLLCPIRKRLKDLKTRRICGVDLGQISQPCLEPVDLDAGPTVRIRESG